MGKPVKLSKILEGMEIQGDQVHSHFDRESGEVVMITMEDIFAAGSKRRAQAAPEWQRESIEMARRIEGDDGSRFVELPSQFEIHDWEIMNQFSRQVKDADVSGRLLEAISGRGAFRFFKREIERLGIEDEWYVFRDETYRRIALDWCRENGIEIEAEKPKGV